MSEINSPVREEGSRAMGGRCTCSFRCIFVGMLERFSGCPPLLLTGRGAFVFSSGATMQQNNARLLVCFGCGFRLSSGRRFSRGRVFSACVPGCDSRRGLLSFFSWTSSKCNRSTKVSTLVRSRIAAGLCGEGVWLDA